MHTHVNDHLFFIAFFLKLRDEPHVFSNVLHHYPTDRYVGAALQLFASVALMLWYVLRLFMASSRN